jgi:hypothetical protein
MEAVLCPCETGRERDAINRKVVGFELWIVDLWFCWMGRLGYEYAFRDAEYEYEKESERRCAECNSVVSDALGREL